MNDWYIRERNRQEREFLRKQKILEITKSNPILFEKVNKIINLL